MKKLFILLPLLGLVACGSPAEVKVEETKKPETSCVVKYENGALSMFDPKSGIEVIEGVSFETAEEVTASVGLCD